MVQDRGVTEPSPRDSAPSREKSAAEPGVEHLLGGAKIVVVMPALNAEPTLRQTVAELPLDVVDEVILVDDGSTDGTVALARELGLGVHCHPRNRGYGGNQKTCYALALERGADIVVMLHPDYQYSPRLVLAMAAMVASGHYDLVLGSRILGGRALAAGMPLYKYLANRLLTHLGNWAWGTRLSELHSGFRAYSRRLLASLPLAANSDDFVFDAELIAQTQAASFVIGEISCPTRYAADSSSLAFWPSCRYGLGLLRVALSYRAHHLGLWRSPLFSKPAAPSSVLGDGEATARWQPSTGELE